MHSTAAKRVLIFTEQEQTAVNNAIARIDDERAICLMNKSDVKKLNVIKRNDLTPLCCHCSNELTDVYSKTEGTGFIKVE